MRGVEPRGEVICGLRKERGWTQRKLAALARCDVKTLRRAEKNLKVDAFIVQALAAVLNVDFAELVVNSRELSQPSRGILDDFESGFRTRNVEQLLGCFSEDAQVWLPEIHVLGFRGRMLNGLEHIREFLSEPKALRSARLQKTATCHSGETTVVLGRAVVSHRRHGTVRLKVAIEFRFVDSLIGRLIVYSCGGDGDSPEARFVPKNEKVP